MNKTIVERKNRTACFNRYNRFKNGIFAKFGAKWNCFKQPCIRGGVVCWRMTRSVMNFLWRTYVNAKQQTILQNVSLSWIYILYTVVAVWFTVFHFRFAKWTKNNENFACRAHTLSDNVSFMPLFNYAGRRYLIQNYSLC